LTCASESQRRRARHSHRLSSARRAAVAIAIAICEAHAAGKPGLLHQFQVDRGWGTSAVWCWTAGDAAPSWIQNSRLDLMEIVRWWCWIVWMCRMCCVHQQGTKNPEAGRETRLRKVRGWLLPKIAWDRSDGRCSVLQLAGAPFQVGLARRRQLQVAKNFKKERQVSKFNDGMASAYWVAGCKHRAARQAVLGT